MSWQQDLQTGVQGASIGMQFGGVYGAVGGLIGGVIDSELGGPLSKQVTGGGASGGSSVQLGTISPDSMSKTFQKFYSQNKEFGKLADFSNQLNEMSQREITGTTPEYFNSLKQADRNVSSMAQGLIPADVLAAANRSSGLAALRGGYGGGSAFGRSNEARQLGLTSLDLQNRAFQELPVLNTLSREANPVSPVNFIFTPQAIQQRSDQVKALNAHLTNQQQLINYGVGQQNMQNDIAMASQIAGLIGKGFSGSGGFGGGGMSPTTMETGPSGTVTAYGGATILPDSYGAFGGGGGG